MKLTDSQKDVLAEIVNIGVGRAAGTLNEVLSAHIILQVPSVMILDRRSLMNELGDIGIKEISAVALTFKGSLAGKAVLIFPPASAVNLVNAITRDESEITDLDTLRIGTLIEVGNILLNGVMGTISNTLKQRLTFTVPEYREKTIDGLLFLGAESSDEIIILVRASFSTESRHINGDIIILFDVSSFRPLVEMIDTIS